MFNLENKFFTFKLDFLAYLGYSNNGSAIGRF